jgi:hypothetical protein
MRFGDDPSLLSPIPSVTPVRIDGTTSRGTDLTYFLEFGDGFVATASQATHVVEGSDKRPQTARLTVVDRFGRTDSEESTYWLFELGISEFVYNNGYWGTAGTSPSLAIFLRNRSGRTYQGDARSSGELAGAKVSATFVGERDLVMTLPEWGVELRGTLVWRLGVTPQMILVQRGGTEDGRTWTLTYRDPY